MKVFFLTFITLVSAINCFSQISYLDFTGLTNNDTITLVPIGTTGATFDAWMTRTGSPPNPTVSSNGNFRFRMNSSTSQHCLNILFSTGAQLYITDNTTGSNIVYNFKDSLTFSTSAYTLVDPESKIISHPYTMSPIGSITSYTEWNVTFDGAEAYQICGQRINPGGGSSNNYIPVRFGVVTSTLPIELINFNAFVTENENVEVTWQTASESNNNYFSIERSNNGLDWEEIKRITGAGNSSNLQSYSVIDTDPYIGTSYYRLKQTDFNGEFEYFDIKSISFIKNQSHSVKIHPNPTSNNINIEGDMTELASIKIFNSLGLDVTNFTTVMMTENTGTAVIDMSNLNSGLYFVQTSNTTNKVYKQ